MGLAHSILQLKGLAEVTIFHCIFQQIGSGKVNNTVEAIKGNSSCSLMTLLPSLEDQLARVLAMASRSYALKQSLAGL